MTKTSGRSDPSGARNNNVTNRGRSNEGGGGRPSSSGNTFKGSCTAMHGHVSQTYAEQSKRGQFVTTLAELQVYCAEKFKDDTEYLKSFFTNLVTPQVPKPQKPQPRLVTTLLKSEDESQPPQEVTVDERTTEEIEVDQMIFVETIKQWVKNTDRLRATLRSIYEIAWGQCSALMQASVKAVDDYETFNSKNDAAALLRAIRVISTQVASDMNVCDAYLESIRAYNMYYQGEHVDVATHLKNFKHFFAYRVLRKT